MLTDAAGQEVPDTRLRYKSYGDTHYIISGRRTPYRFTGQRLDDSTGPYYYGAQYYDPALGRFVQPDTIVPEPGNPQSLNRYSYVLNNPLRYTDPTGYYTNDEIKKYLQDTYGDDWQAFWDAWQADPYWMWILAEAKFPSIFALADVAGLFVHELAHVIDWNSHYSFSGRWGYPSLTEYAKDNKQFYPQSWDRWAEAVAVWMMGDFDATGAFATTYKSREVGLHAANLPPSSSLAIQMNRISELLNGWR